jgi:N-acetylglutamate synthase-like GNAT family acetyltransferase
MERYVIREARRSEQRELTRLCVRATLKAGYDEAFIDRVMPALTVTLPAIDANAVQVAIQESGAAIGVVAVTPTALQGIALLASMFVDPSCWRRGIGRALFSTAVDLARTLNAGALMIYAEPSAQGFYQRMGAIRIGEGPFYFSPEIILPHFVYVLPRRTAPPHSVPPLSELWSRGRV